MPLAAPIFVFEYPERFLEEKKKLEALGLNDRQSSGGAVARSGFEYQNAYALQNLPAWLAHDAYSHLVSESLGDIEVRYFNAKGKTVCRFIEAKETTLMWHSSSV